MTQVQANISSLYSRLNDFRVNDKYCDVTIRVEEESFKCHRLILAATCEYFDVLLGGNFRESKAESIPLKGIDAVAFAEVLNFAYTGKVTVTAENAHSLIVASEYLKLTFIEELCIEYIRQKIPIENVISIFLFARSTKKDSLLRLMNEYIEMNFHTISKTNEFLNLPLNDFRLLLDRYQQHTSSSRNNDLLLDTIMRWVQYARQERMFHFRELIGKVDFAKASPAYMKFMTTKFFFTDVNTSPIDSMECALSNVPSLHVFVEFEDYREEDYSRNYYSEISIFSLIDHDVTYMWHHSDAFSDKTDSVPGSCRVHHNYRDGMNMRHPCKNIKNVSLHNYLYSLNFDRRSGMQKFYAASSIDLIDFHVLKSPPKIVSSYEICASRNSIYLYDYDYRDIYHSSWASSYNEGVDRCFHVYNRELDAWSPAAPVKKMMVDACITADSNLVYMVGGKSHDGQSDSRYFQAYDIRTSQWQELPRSRYSAYVRNPACCLHKEKVYVYGINDDEPSGFIEVFDPAARKWRRGTLPHGINGQYNMRLVSYKGRVSIIGQNHAGFIIKAYDPVKETWSADTASEKALKESIDRQKKKMLSTVKCSQPLAISIKDAVVFEPLEFNS